MKRTFLALNIPLEDRVVDKINTIQGTLKEEKIRWVKTCNMHVTIYFMGNIKENLINDIDTALTKRLQSVNSFEISCKGLGVFRSIYNPKVLWIGIEKSDSLESLKLEVDRVMRSFDYPVGEKIFKPHLTIGRMKLIKHNKQLKLVLDKYKKDFFQKLKVSELVLYESILTQTGSIYGVLKRISLG